MTNDKEKHEMTSEAEAEAIRQSENQTYCTKLRQLPYRLALDSDVESQRTSLVQ
jgi:hypothetical protein